MVKLSKKPVEERFDGPQGKLWKSGTKGTATMFASWVRCVIRANTVNNNAVKTCREYVTQDGNYESLNISLGRKDILPLDIRVRVPQSGNSVINLRYRNDPRAAHWVEKDYLIRDPMALSVDPETKKLISVVFTGPQFSFAGQGSRKLDQIPGYIDALSELERPIREASKILDDYDSSAYKSRNLQDFEALPEVMELKETYSDWNIDIDTSKIASQNKVTYVFNHPTNPDYNFTVYFKDEGGSDYRVYAEFRGEQMGLPYLAKMLAPELKRMQQEADKYIEYESREIKKEMKISGTSELSILGDKVKFDAFIKKLSQAIKDNSLVRYANIDITQNDDGSEDWELILKTQHGEKSVFWTVSPNVPTTFTRFIDSPDGKIKDTVTEDKIAVTDFHTNFGYSSDLNNVGINSPEFFREISKATEKFLEEYGAYNRLLSSTTNIDNQIIGGKNWIQSYNNPDYNLANWADRTLGKIEPELERLQDEYNLSIEKKVEEIEKDDYVDFAAKYGILGNNPQADTARDLSGKLVFTGSYVDKSFTDHLLELRVNFDRGDKFVIWIRPDYKGNSSTKAEGQSDLSFFESWVKQNVALRGEQKTSDNFRQAIAQELINLGAKEGNVKGTLDISTSKIKDVTLDIKVTNDRLYVTAFRDGKVVDKFDMDGKPFAESPVKVAKAILNMLSKHIKESYPSVDRRLPELNKYWSVLFDKLKTEGIQKQECYSSQYIQCGTKRCKAQFGTLGQVTLTSITGKEIASEQFNADPRYFKEDAERMKQLLKENLNRF